MSAPHTRTRIKGIVTLRVLQGGADLADRESPAPSTNKDNYIVVGASTKITITEKRDGNTERYELKGDYTALEPAETVPGKVSFEVSIDRVDLYDANLLEAFGYTDSGSNIVNQLRPMTIFIEQPVPDDGNGNNLTINGKEFKNRTLILPGCWFNGYATEYNIDDNDQKYTLNVTMIARTVIAA